QENIDKGSSSIKKAVGLGKQPNVIPVTKPKFRQRARPVHVGWHPVGGGAGKWFAEETVLGKMITDSIKNYPDPTQHWAVLVGGYAHQLWMDENLDIIYTNQKVVPEEWKTFAVGETRFNDDAIRRTGESTIENIRQTAPAYNLITNNCQTYTLHLLDAIKSEGHPEFGTTKAIYDRMFGPGQVKDLFSGPAQVDSDDDDDDDPTGSSSAKDKKEKKEKKKKAKDDKKEGTDKDGHQNIERTDTENGKKGNGKKENDEKREVNNDKPRQIVQEGKTQKKNLGGFISSLKNKINNKS
ncbi:hypothetical protein GMORB2_4507, partial [Geosmithia morbida]